MDTNRSAVPGVAVLTCLAMLLCATNVHAQTKTSVRNLSYDRKIEPLLTIAVGGAFMSAELLRQQLAPGPCRWCSENSFDSGIQDSVRWSNEVAASRLSDWTAFIIVPGLAAGGLGAFAWMEDASQGTMIDIAIVLESVVTTLALTSWTKLIVGRKRPYLQRITDPEELDRARSDDNNLSFFSGHTSLATSVAFSASMVATLRGYRWAPLLWGLSVPFAAATGYLRMAGDRHYATDVLAGTLIGATSGVLIPWLHREEGPSDVVIAASPSQLTLTMTF